MAGPYKRLLPRPFLAPERLGIRSGNAPITPSEQALVERFRHLGEGPGPNSAQAHSARLPEQAALPAANAHNPRFLAPETAEFRKRVGKVLSARMPPGREERINRIFGVLEHALREKAKALSSPAKRFRAEDMRASEPEFLAALIKSGVPCTSQSLLPFVSSVTGIRRGARFGLPRLQASRDALKSGVLENVSAFFGKVADGCMKGEMHSPFFTARDLAGFFSKSMKGQKLPDQMSSVLTLLEASGKVKTTLPRLNSKVWIPAGITVKGVTWNSRFNALMLFKNAGRISFNSPTGISSASLTDLASADPFFAAAISTKVLGKGQEFAFSPLLMDSMAVLIKKGLIEKKRAKSGKRSHVYYIPTPKGRALLAQSSPGMPAEGLVRILS